MVRRIGIGRDDEPEATLPPFGARRSERRAPRWVRGRARARARVTRCPPSSRASDHAASSKITPLLSLLAPADRASGWVGVRAAVGCAGGGGGRARRRDTMTAARRATIFLPVTPR